MFTNVRLTPQLFVTNSYTKFHVYPTDNLVAGTRSQEDEQTDVVST
jgi:hypothetical protein